MVSFIKTRNPMMLAGVVVALLGLAGLAVPVFSTQETTNVAKIGSLEIQAQESTLHTIPLVVSGGALALGIALVIGGAVYARR